MTTLLWWGLLGLAGLLALLMNYGARELHAFRRQVPQVAQADDLLLYQSLIATQMKLAILVLCLMLVGFFAWGVAWSYIAMRPQAHWWIPGIAWLLVCVWAWFQRGREKVIWNTPASDTLLADRWARLSHIWRRYFWPKFDRALVTEATEWHAPQAAGEAANAAQPEEKPGVPAS